jgi:hypothetical protein
MLNNTDTCQYPGNINTEFFQFSEENLKLFIVIIDRDNNFAQIIMKTHTLHHVEDNKKDSDKNSSQRNSQQRTRFERIYNKIINLLVLANIAWFVWSVLDTLFKEYKNALEVEEIYLTEF